MENGSESDKRRLAVLIRQIGYEKSTPTTSIDHYKAHDNAMLTEADNAIRKWFHTPHDLNRVKCSVDSIVEDTLKFLTLETPICNLCHKHADTLDIDLSLAKGFEIGGKPITELSQLNSKMTIEVLGQQVNVCSKRLLHLFHKHRLVADALVKDGLLSGKSVQVLSGNIEAKAEELSKKDATSTTGLGTNTDELRKKLLLLWVKTIKES
jgi:hypothetical protein